MAPSNTTGQFYSGSFDFTDRNYRGFVATQTTAINAIAWGSDGTLTVLNPKMTVAAGTQIPVWFSGIGATGSLVAYK